MEILMIFLKIRATVMGGGVAFHFLIWPLHSPLPLLSSWRWYKLHQAKLSHPRLSSSNSKTDFKLKPSDGDHFIFPILDFHCWIRELFAQDQAFLSSLPTVLETIHNLQHWLVGCKLLPWAQQLLWGSCLISLWLHSCPHSTPLKYVGPEVNGYRVWW